MLSFFVKDCNTKNESYKGKKISILKVIDLKNIHIYRAKKKVFKIIKIWRTEDPKLWRQIVWGTQKPPKVGCHSFVRSQICWSIKMVALSVLGRYSWWGIIEWLGYVFKAQYFLVSYSSEHPLDSSDNVSLSSAVRLMKIIYLAMFITKDGDFDFKKKIHILTPWCWEPICN